jgi:hypothetical protein
MMFIQVCRMLPGKPCEMVFQPDPFIFRNFRREFCSKYFIATFSKKSAICIIHEDMCPIRSKPAYELILCLNNTPVPLFTLLDLEFFLLNFL